MNKIILKKWIALPEHEKESFLDGRGSNPTTPSPSPTTPSPKPTRAPQKAPEREIAPTRQAFQFRKKKPKATKARPAKVPEKDGEVGANSEMIREFTLMISKLLFQLSQMKA